MSRIVLICLVLLAVTAAPTQANSTQGITFEAPRDLLDPDERAGALAELDGLGVRALRIILTWKDVAPAPTATQMPAGFNPSLPAGYNWGQYDPLMAAVAQRGWDVTMTISGPVPKWATQARRDHLTRPRPSAFGAFVTAVARKYGQQVEAWSIWNEPNQPQFLRPQFSRGRPASPGIYRRLYQAAVRGLKDAGQGDKTTLIGETSPRGTRKVVAPLTFLRGMFCLDSRYRKREACNTIDADGYAHHPYTTSQGPYFRPPSTNDVTIGVLSRLTRALDRAERADAVSRRLPLHLTEFGVQSFPDRQSGVSPQQQVEFRALSERIAYSNPRVRAFSQYLLTDADPTGPNQFGGFESGLRYSDGRAKPSLAAFPRTISALRKGDKVSLWGVVRPVTGPTDVTITYRNPGQDRERELETVRTDSRGYWRMTGNLKKGRRWNIEWQGRKGTAVRLITRPKG